MVKNVEEPVSRVAERLQLHYRLQSEQRAAGGRVELFLVQMKWETTEVGSTGCHSKAALTLTCSWVLLLFLLLRGLSAIVILIQPVKFACTYWPSDLQQVFVLSSLLGRSEGGFQKQVLVLLSQDKAIFFFLAI